MDMGIMGAVIGIIAVVIGVMADFMATKGRMVWSAEVMNSTAGTASMAAVATASMVEARFAAEAAASTVAAEDTAAGTGKRGLFA